MEFEYKHRIGGQKRRDFVREVAATADRVADMTFTNKFKLELGERADSQLFDHASKTYNITEGTGRGSLTGVLLLIHLSGFRAFYSAATGTTPFRNRKHLPIAAFDIFVESNQNLDFNSDFNPLGIYSFLVRQRRGKNTVFDQQSLHKVLFELFSSKKYEEAAANEILLTISQKVSSSFVSRFKSWKDVNTNIENACRLIDLAFTEEFSDYPSLSSSMGALGSLTPEGSTIDFDPSLLVLHPNDFEELEDYLLHITVAQKINSLRNFQQVENISKVKKKSLQDEISTETHAALSWLFNSGYHYFKEKSVADILEDYQLSENQRFSINAIKEWMQEIPKDELFDLKHYADFRTSIGGKIDSWLANYLQRLKDLHSALASIRADHKLLPDWMFEEDHKNLWSGNSISPIEFLNLNAELVGAVEASVEALNTISGFDEKLPTLKDFEVIEKFSELLNLLASELALLQNRLNQKEKQDVEVITEVSIPKWLKQLPAMPKISGGIPNAYDELQTASQRFRELYDFYDKQLDEYTTQISYANAIAELSMNLEKNLREHKNAHNFNYLQLAQRRLLDNLIATVSNCGNTKLDSYLSELLHNLKIGHNKEINRLIFNKQGRIFVHPYSNSRHQGLDLNPQILNQVDCFEIAQKLIKFSHSFEDNSIRLKIDLRLKSFILRNKVNAIREPIKTADLDLDLLRSLNLPPGYSTLLNQITIESDGLNTLFNFALSELMGLLNIMTRNTFFIRTKFQIVGTNAVFYVPKLNNSGEWKWRCPQHILEGNSLLATTAKRFIDEDGTVNLVDMQTMQKELKAMNGNSALLQILRQAPHDWYVETGLSCLTESSNQPLKKALRIDKKRGWTLKDISNSGLRLIGPCSRKAPLDEMLVNPDLTCGDYTLLIEQEYKQILNHDISNHFDSVDIKPNGKPNLEVALPIKRLAPVQKEQFLLAETIIGIDLGEAGIGYSVFKVDKEFELIDSGAIPIKSIRNLIRNVKKHRKIKQPRQKFTQRHSTALMELRENATGDVVHNIESLCSHFKGFPVLESSVRNLASGSNQLQLIYDRVLNLYSYSDVDANMSERKHHWQGSTNWTHPSLTYVKESKDNKGVLKRDDLKLFPGVVVHPAGTSQRCSQCNRNPIDLLKLNESNNFMLNHLGIIEVVDQNDNKYHLELLTNSNPEISNDAKNLTAKRLRRRKERAPYQYPLISNKLLQGKDILKHLRRQIRRPQLSTRSRDTTQSMYHCCFVDCRNQMHADENAAINIVRKWITDKQVELKN